MKETSNSYYKQSFFKISVVNRFFGPLNYTKDCSNPISLMTKGEQGNVSKEEKLKVNVLTIGFLRITLAFPTANDCKVRRSSVSSKQTMLIFH